MEETLDTSEPEPATVPKLTLEDLPNEILTRVIEHVDTKTLPNVNLVCKRWYSVVNEVIGRKLFVGRQCQLVPMDQDRYLHNYVDISEIAKVGVAECFVGEIADPIRSMTLWTRFFTRIKKTLFREDENAEFKYPYLVKTIHFDGPIPSQNFECMMKNLVNLSKLEMHMTSFSCLRKESVIPLGQKLKNLKELVVWGHKLTDGLFTDFYDAKTIMPNLLVFISNDFRALSNFGLEYPFDIRDERRLTQELLSYLRRHSKLEALRICINIPISDESAEFDTFEDREWSREAKAISKQLNLKYMELIVSSMRRVRLTKVWMTFIENQRTLESATILSFRIPANLLSSICQNSRECLKKLFISRILMTNGTHPIQIDASTILPCTRLIELTMEGMMHSQSVAGLLNARLLPKTLVLLEIGGMLLLHEDAHDLFFQLPILNTISLTDIGNRGQFGLTVESIRQVIAERRIVTVNVYRCICGEYPTLGINNGDPNNHVNIRQRPYEILEMKLNAEGYYENMYRQAVIEEFDDD